jgi:acyl-CoA synthetase (AMP-forming)/AMP-acid ligase II
MANRQPSALLAVPLFHSSGCYSIFLSNLLRGGKIVILQKWHAAQALELIERERITAFSGAPTMMWDLLRLDRSGRDLSCLLSIGVGGQALQPHLLREIVAAFPNAILGGGYGMTESNGSVCLIAGEELLLRPTSSGRVLAAADIKLVDDDDAEVEAGAVGEICLRGAMLMRGYCRRPDETATALRGGWLHTGDLGRLDADGYLHVIDRKKDIVISVVEAAAFGVSDARLGEILVLAVVTNRTVDAQVLKDHVAERLAIYKVPRALLHSAELPRNALGKVNRNELRRLYNAQHPALQQ